MTLQHLLNSYKVKARVRVLGVFFSQMRLLSLPKRLSYFLLTCEDKATLAKLHALVILTGLFNHGSSKSRLLTSYARVVDVASARQLFEKLPHRGVDVWNAMIIAYSRKQYPVKVLKLYRRMLLEGVKPDSSTFTVAIKACASMLDLDSGEEIWFKAIDYGYESDVFVGSSILNLYAKCRKMDEASVLFDKMPKKDIVCWTSMLTGFVQSGRPVEALQIYKQMQMKGMKIDGVVMLGLVQVCAQLGDSKLGLSVHGYLIRRDHSMHVILQTSLVDMYAKTGKLEHAYCVFMTMPYKNVISWGALISGYAQNGFARNALEMLVEMQSCGYKPDQSSLMGALLASSQVGSLKLGKSLHGYIVRRFLLDQVSGTSLIDMYSKCGSLSCARSLFDRINTKDSISWNAMIASYGIHGHGKEALALFLKMTEIGLKPDHTTFASLLSSFSHSGLVEEGQYWFGLMLCEYNIPPCEKHYACMVDLLARAGRVEEAYDLIGSMITEPGLPVWVALLAGCHIHQKVIIGELAAKKALRLKPNDMGVYSLISNFYAMAKMWNGVASVRNIMKDTGIKKVPGYSVVEVNRKLHSFVMGDIGHHQYKAIMQLLDNLDQEMRIIQFVPETGLLFHDYEGE